MTSTIEIGDAVRVSVGNGLFLHGPVQEVNGEQVRVRGRWFPLSVCMTEEALETAKRENISAERKQRETERAAKEAAELALKGEMKVPVMLPTGGSYNSFVALLESIGYYFDVRVREDGIETADAEYRTWAGEELPEFAVYLHTNPEAWTAVEWRILATVPEGTFFPFETAVAGTLGRGHAVDSALLNGNKLTINCSSIVEQLVRHGLRVRKERAWRY